MKVFVKGNLMGYLVVILEMISSWISPVLFQLPVFVMLCRT